MQESELERLQVQLSAAQQSAEAAKGRELETRAQCREYSERARKAETQSEEQASDLASARCANIIYIVFLYMSVIHSGCQSMVSQHAGPAG